EPVPDDAGGIEIHSADPFTTYVQQTILQLIGRLAGGDSVSAPIAATNRSSRIVRNLLRAIYRAERPLILLGEPGSGKTMTLQTAAARLAERELRRLFPRVILFVRLGEFHVPGPKPVDAGQVRAFVERSAPSAIRQRLTALMHAERLVVFFDGMD